MQGNWSLYLISRAALFTGCLFVLSACENTQQEVDALFKKRVAVEEGVKVESFLSQDGKTKARLRAPYMIRQQVDSPYIEFPKTLHVDFFDDSLRIETIMDAHYAKYFDYQGKVLLRDSVVVINIKNHDTLRTPELWWDRNKQEFSTDKPSRINKADGTITFSQKGMRAKQDLSWYELYGNSGQLPMPKDSLP
ncbi:MAG: LPS export ABC transporter periplasmic protein LptC [Candidatus Pseudobacter hemicellulosilyticus]|uniref:LPS export ABC transporter periplasmic protein LptC n=1 Tax=Candidatus Pseudobacter hemicellulosilyticus TaxID=3121375 RepID=A0AAJ5WV76_9BACT|nr:MAG: LPS export ABC transporter periplasmic protein LptC [Pseudobacter sp.]